MSKAADVKRSRLRRSHWICYACGKETDAITLEEWNAHLDEVHPGTRTIYKLTRSKPERKPR
jgi:hypothetical protein